MSDNILCPKCHAADPMFNEKKQLHICEKCGNEFAAAGPDTAQAAPFPADTPPASVPVRVFLSYARADDEPFVRRLYDDLTARGFTVWFDRESLMSRGRTFHHEIKEAIRLEVDRLVYIGGPKAVLSVHVQEEWQTALELDKIVIPILRLGEFEQHIPGELSLLHCDDFRDDGQYTAQLEKLAANLSAPAPPLGALMGVPSLPPHFLGRPELMRRVRDALLVDLQTTKVITSADARVGMQGMGGIGKSVLAAALARNREVRQAYPDGIVWVSCKQNLTPGDLVSRQRDVARTLGCTEEFDSVPQGQAVLRKLLTEKAVLIILDNVWQAADAQAFDALGTRCRMLVTTRDAGILHALNGELVPVSLFTEPEALQLLADAVGVAPAELPAVAVEVARECGMLPLAVALCGGMAKKRGGDFSSVLERLRRADLEKIADRENINEEHRSIWRAMQASIDMLTLDEQKRFAELAVFSTDRQTPQAAVATLWLHTGNLDDLDSEDLLINFAERSLIQLEQKADAEEKPFRRIRLHDLLHDFAMRIVGNPQALHNSLIEAYKKKCPGGWPTGPNDGYFYQELCNHLIAAQHWDELETVLTDLEFIEAKCTAGLTDGLVDDYKNALAALPEGKKECVEVFNQEFLRQAHHLRQRPDLTFQQMYNELQWRKGRVKEIAEQARQKFPEKGGMFLHQHRIPKWEKSHLLMTISGHSASVYSCSYSPDGRRIVSASGDHTLKIWDAETGKEITTLAGHSGWVASCSYSPDGRRIVSASDDKTLKIWDAETGLKITTLSGHSSLVRFCSYSPDGRRIVSASADFTLKIWDAETGLEITTLTGHSNCIESGSYSTDSRRIVSASQDRTLKIWDAETGLEITTLTGHSGVVWSCSYSPDSRRIVSASQDKTLKIWDAETGKEIAAFLCESIANACTISGCGEKIACGDSAGNFYLLKPEGFTIEPPIVTAGRLWEHDSGGSFASDVNAACPYCGVRSPVPAPVIDATTSINKKQNIGLDDSASTKLPAEAWDDPALLSECPKCGKSLKFNPFVVDNRDRY